MKKKKTILFVIDSLGRGGAETLLVGILPDLCLKWNVVIVTLTDLCEFTNEELHLVKRYSLGYQNKSSYPFSIFKLNKILRKCKPSFVHAHLLNSSIIARMACPKNIPLIYSIHSILSLNAFNNSFWYRNIEKKVFDKKDRLIAVSDEVLKDYQFAIGKNDHCYVLKNYVADAFFNTGIKSSDFNTADVLKMVAVGNVKKVKNYEYLLQAFMELKDKPVMLHIYGKPELDYATSLQQIIDKNQLPIQLKGPVSNVPEILPQYDLYVMCSKNEGFGMAAIEAMAVGLPALLSDIPVLREVTFSNALFFNVADTASFTKIILDILNGTQVLKVLSQNGKEIAKQYSRQKYIKELFAIYETIV